MVEHKTNVSETYLPVFITTAEMSNLMKETAVSKTKVSATTLTLTIEAKQFSTRSEVWKVPRTFKTSVPLYQSPWCNIPKDMNQITKTLVFG
jgi:hypothetical protein